MDSSFQRTQGHLIFHTFCGTRLILLCAALHCCILSHPVQVTLGSVGDLKARGPALVREALGLSKVRTRLCCVCAEELVFYHSM